MTTSRHPQKRNEFECVSVLRRPCSCVKCRNPETNVEQRRLRLYRKKALRAFIQPNRNLLRSDRTTRIALGYHFVKNVLRKPRTQLKHALSAERNADTFAESFAWTNIENLGKRYSITDHVAKEGTTSTTWVARDYF